MARLTPPDATSLAAAARAAGGKGLPPVMQWNPPDCGDLDMRIARDGTWFYQGTPIGRAGLVRLFSTILRRDDDRYVLVTPVEKVGIIVEDVPFLAIDFAVSGDGDAQILTFTTNVGDSTRAGPDAPLRFEQAGDEHIPYVTVRDRLEARVDRKSFYRLVELGTVHEGNFGLWSGGVFFDICPEAALG